tara:strand:- start:563 stop:1360 length:798 start_codon:yes stop_codon:yes gene_type:complete
MENTQNIKDLIQKFYPHAKKKLGFDHPVRVIMRQDAENAKDSLGKTAYYDPAEKLIVLYVTNRHPKDVLRSFSHELVHHAQNCRGDLDGLSTDGHYAKDGKEREIEAEAYLLGNGFLVRDWEDGMKHEGVNEMKLTKSQLKGIIEQTVKNLISEKDADGDGSPAPPKWADPDDNDPKVKAPLQKEEEVDEMHCGGNRDDKKEDQLEEEEADSGDELAAAKSLGKELGKKLAQDTQEKKPMNEAKETNKTWYDTSLYGKLVSRWTK